MTKLIQLAFDQMKDNLDKSSMLNYNLDIEIKNLLNNYLRKNEEVPKEELYKALDNIQKFREGMSDHNSKARQWMNGIQEELNKKAT